MRVRSFRNNRSQSIGDLAFGLEIGSRFSGILSDRLLKHLVSCRLSILSSRPGCLERMRFRSPYDLVTGCGISSLYCGGNLNRVGACNYHASLRELNERAEGSVHVRKGEAQLS